MSDPLDRRLRDFAMDLPTTPMSPASPADVRRRGDRLRRRRTTMAAAGAALAVVLVATPVAVLAGDDGSRDAEPAPAATETPGTPAPDDPTATTATTLPADGAVVDALPDDVPITASYPAENLDGSPVVATDEPGLPSIEMCGSAVWTAPDDALDVAGAVYDGAEDFRRRTLALYPSTEAAETALRSVRDAVGTCPTEGDESSGSTWAEDARISTDDAVAVTRRFTTGGLPTPGLDVYWLVREGNALLVDHASGEGGTTGGTVRSFVDLVVEDAGPVVEAMESLARGSSGAPRVLSPQFLPRPDALPRRDRLTAWEEVAAPDDRLVGCEPDGVDSGATEVISRSYAAAIAPVDDLPGGELGDAEVRISVLQFASDADADAAEAVVLDWVQRCDDPAGAELDDAVPVGGPVETDQAGTYGTWTYAAPEKCSDDCGAAWFERMGVLADQGRMVVVSFREVGGPLEPEGLDGYMEALMLRAAGGSMPG